MNLFPHKRKPRKRKPLSSEEMNVVSANNAHSRNEKWKQATNTMKIAMVSSAIIAVPVLFVAWCVATFFISPEKLPDNLYLGITAIVSFILGKSGILGSIFKDKED